MPITDRELRTNQENKLFEIYTMQRMYDEGRLEELRNHLESEGEKAQSGMTSEEIDAVRERVNRAQKRRNYGTN